MQIASFVASSIVMVLVVLELLVYQVDRSRTRALIARCDEIDARLKELEGDLAKTDQFIDELR